VIPPLFSTFSALTELFVTAVVLWFFYKALKFADYRFGIMGTALLYETAFNIVYMVSRLFVHEEGVTHTHAPWVSWFVGFHGALSLLMFIGLIWIVVWSYRRVRRGDANPLLARRRLSRSFLALWIVSVVTGEIIYAMYWLDLIGPGSG
jgi:uncharacterized membrane protein YozB (DUF420 family)